MQKKQFFFASYGHSFIMCDGALARIAESSSMVKPFTSRAKAEKAIKDFCAVHVHEVESFEIEPVMLEMG